MALSPSRATPGTQSPLRVLAVTGDMPSHPVAVAKLALCLADAGHHVTIAAPEGEAFRIAEQAVAGSASPISVVPAGQTSTKVQLNVHGSTDVNSWRQMVRQLLHPIPECVADAADMTAPMFEPLLALMRVDPPPDVVVLSHYMWSVAGDAAEVAGIPAVSFVHLPYDPALFLGEESAWRYPSMLPSFPHVAAYPLVPSAGLQGWRQLWWKWVDSKISAAAWARAARRQNALRVSRGLPPTSKGGWAGFLASHPAVVLGGPPFGPPAPVPPLAVVVGAVEPKSVEKLPADLAAWLQENSAGVMFISMGTGMTLNAEEARELAGGLGRRIAGETNQPKLLWALRASEQERLQGVLKEELGAPDEATTPGAISFCGGRVRIESYVPQRAVLNSGQVSVFISHMGFGACTEGVSAGVRFVAYPGGFDQEFNASRAVEAGFAVRAPMGLAGIEGVIREALADMQLAEGARRARCQLNAAGGSRAAVEAVERFAALGREGAQALILPFGGHGHSHQQEGSTGAEATKHVGASSFAAAAAAAAALGIALVLSVLVSASPLGALRSYHLL
mmetsp:Transcript_95991/g.240599  ORF Transcript_95991/g.240599 Transcript_95991/m.240599 type:complete len:563 (+) Transcript_95991:95-1783(+)